MTVKASGMKYRVAAVARTTPSPADLAWAAGFIEGEGTFAPIRAKLASGKTRTYNRILAYQNNPEPLERLQAMFGGLIRRFGRKKSRQEAGTWQVNGARARGVMFTLYTFLSAKRRQQIRAALEGAY